MAAEQSMRDDFCWEDSPTSTAPMSGPEKTPLEQPQDGVVDTIQPPDDGTSPVSAAANSTSRLWAMSMTLGSERDLPTAGSAMPLKSGLVLLGHPEETDNQTSVPHVHLLYKSRDPVRKKQVVTDTLEVLQTEEADRTVSYASPVRVVPAYLKYMFKSAPLSDKAVAVIALRELGLTLKRSLPATQGKRLKKSKPATTVQSDGSDSDIADDGEVSVSSDAGLNAVLNDLAKQFTSKPYIDVWCEYFVKKVGVAYAARKMSAAKLFYELWPQHGGAVSARNETIWAAMTKPLQVDTAVLATALVKALTMCRFGIPADMDMPNKQERLMYVLCVMFAIRCVRRPPGLDIKMLWLSGAPGVGKTVLGRFICGPDQRTKTVAGDAMGVGRFQLTRYQEAVLFDEATSKQISSEYNLRTINALCDGMTASVKIYASTQELRPTWVVVTSNVILRSLTLADQNDKLSADKPHSMRRRFIEINSNEPIFDNVEQIVAATDTSGLVIREAIDILLAATSYDNYGPITKRLLDNVRASSVADILPTPVVINDSD